MENQLEKERILAVGRSGRKKVQSSQPGYTSHARYIKSAAADDVYTEKALRRLSIWSWFWLIMFGLNLLGFFILKFNPEWLNPLEGTQGAIRYILTVFVFNFVFIFKGTITSIILLMFVYNRMAFYNAAVDTQDTKGIFGSLYYSKYQSPAYNGVIGHAYQRLTLTDVLQELKNYMGGPSLYLIFSVVATVIIYGYSLYYLLNVVTNTVALSIADAFVMIYACYESVFVVRYLYSNLKIKIIDDQ
jgi:hypothetical protein